MIPHLKELIAASLDVHSSKSTPDMCKWQQHVQALSQQGMGPDIALLMNHSLTRILESYNKNQKTFLTVIALFQYIGMLTM
jgi:hypothetical protein